MRQYSRYVWWLRAPGWYWGGRGLCRGLPRQGPTLVSCLPQLCLTLYFLSPAVAGLYWVICTIVLHCCLPQGVGLLTPAANWCLHARTSETERERVSGNYQTVYPRIELFCLPSDDKLLKLSLSHFMEGGGGAYWMRGSVVCSKLLHVGQRRLNNA